MKKLLLLSSFAFSFYSCNISDDVTLNVIEKDRFFKQQIEKNLFTVEMREIIDLKLVSIYKEGAKGTKADYQKFSEVYVRFKDEKSYKRI